jgi:acyl carrier protein
MEQTLRQIVAKIAETAPDFDAGASFRDALNIDSVRALEVVFEIEKVFKISVPEERYAEVKNFNDLFGLVSSIKKP